LNYSGKIDANAHTEGLGANFGGFSHGEAVHGGKAPVDAIVVSDAQLLFHADFKRAGVDLVLSGDGREVVLHDYFKGEHRAPIASPDGAHLTGDIVTALAGEVQLAQADGSAGAHTVIGHVTKLVGSATAIRNGVSIILNNGDNVEKGDVVASGSDSTVGITFIDGTVFGLSSNARMVLNEMVYDPNGSNNSSLLSLVAGTITFVAGETAKHGDMKVDTPVATMGIRGTAVLVEIDFTVPGATPDAKFQVLVEPDGTTGSYILYDKQTLTPLAVVDQAGHQINISNGVLSQTLVPLSPEIQQLINDVFSLKFTDSSNTKSIEHFTDSIIPTDGLGLQFAGLNPSVPVSVTVTTFDTNSPSNFSSGPPPIILIIPHIPNALHIATTNGIIVGRAGAAGTGQDTVSGTINFVDGNPTDHPTVSTQLSSFTLQNAQGRDISGTLAAQQINAVEAALTLTANPGNNNNGVDTWTYGIPTNALSFLSAGETLTLTYNATVNDNYGPHDETVTAPITITIKSFGEIWSETREIASPAPGDWSNGANWQTGVAPTATDDVIIVTDPAQSGTPFYPVTIKSVEGGAAFANSVTMNDLGDIRPELDNFNTLTIGSGGLHLNADSILKNFGDLNVGGLAEILQSGLLQNSGFMTLEQGGDFKDSSSIINSGTIELAGGTLGVDVDIANSGGTLQVDSGATLTLSGATIDGGAINGPTGFSFFSSIAAAGPSTISNASLNYGGVNIASGVTLTLDNDTVNGTAFNDTASGAAIQIDDGTVLTLTGVAINGGIINDGTIAGTSAPVFGSIDITSPSTIDNVFLNDGGVTIASGVTLTLDNDTVSGTTFNDTASGATIQIDDGTVLTLAGATINGGIIQDGSSSGTGEPALFGSIAVNGPSTISNAFLSNGGVTIASDVTLTLSNDIITATTFFGDVASGTAQFESGDTFGSAFVGTITGTIDIGGAVTFQSGVVVNGGAMSIARGATLDIENPVTGVGATLNDVVVNNSGTIQVDSAGPGSTVISLVLDDGTQVTGGTLLIHVNFPVNGIEGAVEIGTGGATFNNVTVDDNNILTIDDGVVLTLDDNTVFNHGNLAIGTLGALDVEQGPGALSDGTPEATLDGVAVANGGNIEVGTTEAGDTSLLLDDGTMVNNGLLTVGSAGTLGIGVGGATLDGVTVEDNNLLKIDDSVTLALTDNTVISNGNLTIDTLGMLDVEQGSGALSDGTPAATLGAIAVANGGNIEVGTTSAGDPILLLDDATVVSNGAITVGLNGTLEVGAGGATLNDVTVVNGNGIEVLAGNVLDVDFGTTIVNFDATVTVDVGATLDLDGAVVAGGTLGGDGTIATMGGVNTFDDVAIASATTVDVTDNTVLDLNGLITNDGVIALNSSGDATELQIFGDALLEGGGQVVLSDNAQNAIVSDGSVATLTNANTIAGAGTIGDSLLTLVNDGNIDATGSNALIIDTGVNTATNAGPEGSHWFVGSLEVTNDSAGVLEASAGHVLQIDDNVLNNGLIQAGDLGGTSTAVVNVAGNISGTGSIDIFDNAQVEIGGSVSSGQTVTFEVANGSAGLILDDPHDFQGVVQGLVEASSEASENYIDLKGFEYTSETRVVSASFDSATDVTAVTIADGSSANNLTIDLAGNYQNGGIEFASDRAGGTLFSDPAVHDGAVTINSNTTLDIAGASNATVSFANGNGTTGELVLENSKAFTGLIAGFAGDGTISSSDLIDLTDVNIAGVAMNKTGYTENGNGTGTLTLYNANGHALDQITFDGSYQLANFTVENDGSGHTLIVDPPASSGANASSSVVPNDVGPVANPQVMHDPGPPGPSSTIVANAPIKPSNSVPAGDNFAFNFEGVGHATVTDFHPLSEGLQFGSSTLASVQALFGTHDDGHHGNAVSAVDGHDTVTLSDVHQTLLHMGDFHFV
jgi:fibronectin-binding autotransporter adhesin